MNYEQICQYIFDREIILWDYRDSKKRDRNLVEARQICIYIGNWFIPVLTWSALALPFGKDHATAMHAVKHIRELMYSDKVFGEKVLEYMKYVREQNKIEAKEQAEKLYEDRDKIEKLYDLIDKMELVAKVYCDITNKKMI